MSLPSPDFRSPGEQIQRNNQLANQLQKLVPQRYSLSTPEPLLTDEEIAEAQHDMPEELRAVYGKDIAGYLQLKSYADKQYRSNVFSSSNMDVNLHVGIADQPISRALQLENFAYAPDNLRFPAVAIELGVTDEKIATQYDELPDLVKDNQGNCYQTTSILFMNEFGQGIKLTQLQKLHEESLIELGIDTTTIYTVATAKEGNSYSPMKKTDYDLLETSLKWIQKKYQRTPQTHKKEDSMEETLLNQGMLHSKPTPQ
jgi:hypothetical protein